MNVNASDSMKMMWMSEPFMMACCGWQPYVSPEARAYAEQQGLNTPIPSVSCMCCGRSLSLKKFVTQPGTFNPLTEHRWFCPLVVPKGMF